MRRKIFLLLYYLIYFGKILHHYNFRKSEYFRQMGSVIDSLTLVSHLNIGFLLRFRVVEKYYSQTGVNSMGMK